MHGQYRGSAEVCTRSAPDDHLERFRRRPEIKLRQLRYFLAGAEHLHFSKAAESQCVSQSTLSHQIAELEGQIGQPLFDRAARSVRLTPAGEVFRVYAQRIVTEVDAGCSALHELDEKVAGSLRVGATQSFVFRHLGAALAGFMAENPAVRLHVEELTALEIEHRLCSGQLDLGIAFAPTVTAEVCAEAIAEEEMVLLTGPDHHLAGLSSVRLAALEHEPLALLSSDPLARRHIEGCFRQAGVAPRVVCEANNLGLMLDLVRSCRIAAIVPACMADADTGLHAATLTHPRPRRTVALLRARQHHESAAVRSLVAILRRRFAGETVNAPAAPRIATSRSPWTVASLEGSGEPAAVPSEDAL